MAKRAVLGLKNKREKAFLLLKSQLFHIQVVRYVASTIKSFFNALTASNASISIPHGTIKRVFVSTPYPPYDIFQFHMVRLKGSWRTRGCSRNLNFNSTWHSCPLKIVDSNVKQLKQSRLTDGIGHDTGRQPAFPSHGLEVIVRTHKY